jgi:hypothetical protein
MIQAMYEAAAKFGYARGERDKGGALFARQAISEKVAKVLGKRPTCLSILRPRTSIKPIGLYLG